MIKMRLAAIPPNEGARRLAWHVLHVGRGDLGILELASGVGADLLQRLITGEVIPGSDLSEPIAFATSGLVTHFDWQHSPRGGWFEDPAQLKAPRAA